jgi:hypothetical protein
MIAGRVVDARTGKGIGRVSLRSISRERDRYLIVGEATTAGTITVRPGEVKGPLKLSIGAKHALRIRGAATDIAGKGISGAEVTLRWNRPFPAENQQEQRVSLGRPLECATTGDNGRFTFQGLWPGLSYELVMPA